MNTFRVLILLSWMFLSDAAIAGRVIEHLTGKPLAGAALMIYWRVPGLNPVDSSSVCTGLDVVVSDSEGYYQYPARKALGKESISVYKSGYRLLKIINRYEPLEQVLLVPHSSEQSERFKQVLKPHIPFQCPEDEVRSVIEPVLRPMYEEARALARTQQQWEEADGVLGAIESLELGMERASQNAERRRLTNPFVDNGRRHYK